MIGYIIAGLAALVLTHKAQASGTPTPATQVTIGPVPAFGVVTQNTSVAPSREPGHVPFDVWQKGPMLPVPTGSRGDVFPPNAGAISDSVQNQIVQLGQFVSGAANVRNPESPTPQATGGTSGAVNIPTSSGAGAPSSGTGGGTSFGGGGGLGGRRPNIL